MCSSYRLQNAKRAEAFSFEVTALKGTNGEQPLVTMITVLARDSKSSRGVKLYGVFVCKDSRTFLDAVIIAPSYGLPASTDEIEKPKSLKKTLRAFLFQ
mmetsp:Transcript_13251/g.20447  ORF Transcript_13251/g.20447 Transcript_13251/m.20447 type:complete len:99 (+) Transcript_13251:280-576(+)